jgi:hypothetical protein
MSRVATDWAKPAEIARFLRMEPADVATLIKSDGLPATKIPSKTRNVTRVWLRDLQKWLLANTRNAPATGLADFETFCAEFAKHRAPSPKQQNTPTP